MAARRMKIGLDLECQFFIPAHDRNRNLVSSRNEKRRINHIFRVVHLCLADLKKDIASLDPRAKGRRVLHDFRHLRTRAGSLFPPKSTLRLSASPATEKAV